MKSIMDEIRDANEKSKEKKESTEEEIIWDKLMNQECPDCGAKNTIMEGPHGGMAVNVKCSACNQGYNITPVRGFGVARI